MITLVRVPYLSEYNHLDVREEPVISSLAGYLHAIGAPHRVFDFHLDHSLTIEDLAAGNSDTYIIGVRGTGLHWKYAERVTAHLVSKTNAQVIVYGQTGKLRHRNNPFGHRVSVVHHDEQALAQVLGMPTDGPDFEGNLQYHPYAFEYLPRMGHRRKLFKATIETTRGCHYGCKFCFINHGKNYRQRFARRPTESVISNMRAYIERGASRFWFYDSEFLGADRSQHPRARDLLERIRDEFSGSVEIMLYNRADTLASFDGFRLMSDAGVNSVLLGIESLDATDLREMRKKQRPMDAIETIRKLRDHEIFCNLSFILFNRTATAKSIAQNIEALSQLYSEPGSVFLGQTLYFTYAFESDWTPRSVPRKLSGLTRLGGSTGSTRVPTIGVSFDPALEPLAEICRIINYEQVRKLCELNLAKETPEHQGLRNEMHRWAMLLNPFTLNVMRTALDEFESGRLRLDTVTEYEHWVYESFAQFNASLLPKQWRHTITDVSGYPAGDWNGWERQIPTP